MGLLFLFILIVAVGAVVAVVGWVAGWWLTTETDAHGEPGSPEQQRQSRPRPTHTRVEDEADQTFVGGPDDRT